MKPNNSSHGKIKARLSVHIPAPLPPIYIPGRIITPSPKSLRSVTPPVIVAKSAVAETRFERPTLSQCDRDTKLNQVQSFLNQEREHLSPRQLAELSRSQAKRFCQKAQEQVEAESQLARVHEQRAQAVRAFRNAHLSQAPHVWQGPERYRESSGFCDACTIM